MPSARAFAPLALALLLGCSRAAVNEPIAWVDASGRGPLPAGWRAQAAPHDALVGGRLKLIGARVDASSAPGGRIEGTLLWLVLRDCAGLEPRVFVHATAEGAELNLAQADHNPAYGVMSPTEWRVGDVLEDGFALAVPKGLAVDELSVRVGLYQQKDRWDVEPAAAHDGANRIEVARVKIVGAPALAARADIPRRTGPIVIDGVLDEADWAKAAALGPFAAYDGKGVVSRATTARMLWDDDALYLAFVAEDPDPFTPYSTRDDPLYDSEALEIFIDADGDADQYVELQSASNDVHFDAAFSGGRRKNMDKGFNADFETKTRIEGGTVTQEWRIPVKDLRDVPAGEPRAGASWRVNLFRLERVRDDARARVMKNEASAWSPPLSGDFHNLARLGTITFR